MEEKVFLDSSNVKVTNTRFVVGSQTYAMSSVNSVKTNVRDVTPNRMFAILMMVVGLVWLINHGLGNTREWGGYFLPIAIMAGGFFWNSRIKEAKEYSLVLTTSSGETSALTGRNGDHVRKVEAAITDAIIYRG